MSRLRLSKFGTALAVMAVAVVVLALIGEHTAGWIIGIVGLLALGGAYVPKAGGQAVDDGLRFRNYRRFDRR